jgi:hypothetical protein
LQQTVGELDWRCYFKTWGDADPDRAAAGWGGGLLTVWERDGKPLAATATRWDSAADAARFESAYRRSLERRFGAAARGSTPRHAAHGRASNGAHARPWENAHAELPAGAIRRPDGTAVVIERRDLDVDILDGVRPAKVEPLRAILRAATRVTAAPREAPAKP